MHWVSQINFGARFPSINAKIGFDFSAATARVIAKWVACKMLISSISAALTKATPTSADAMINGKSFSRAASDSFFES